MTDFSHSTQLHEWIYTPQLLQQCRKRANRQARDYLCFGPAPNSQPPVADFARGFKGTLEGIDDGPAESPSGNAFLSPVEEGLLVDFYAAKLPSLIGPLAQLPRLRREVKVSATAALLFRRFYLSNSVMLFDPKAIMVAAAFLASKVEDAMSPVQYFEEGTKLMNAPVTMTEILSAELTLLPGIKFDFMCFHPYKAVLAFTEDLRTFLKTDKGRTMATFTGDVRTVIGQDLKAMHDGARQIVDDVVVSDVPLLYSPGQIGMAALMVANEQVQTEGGVSINLLGYVHHRFDQGKDSVEVESKLPEVCKVLKGLKDGLYGCGNHNVDIMSLKAVHKKLKKCRIWGLAEKKSKKKKKGDGDGEEDIEPEAKKIKMEEP